MLTFQQGLDFLGDKPKKALEHKTYLVKYDDDTLGVVFHTTIVVYIFRSGIYQYDTGGWRNTSVKNRINKYGPKKIHHKHGMWMLDNSIFDDGVRLNTNGDILTPLRTVAVKQKQTLDSKVLKYVNNFCDHVLKHGLKLAGNIDNPWHVDLKGQELLFPGVGDCWSCYFGLTSDSHLKEPLGVQHLLEHIENSYFVPSLLAKAIITTTDNPVPYLVWNDIAEEVNQGNADSVKKVLKKYFRARKSLMS
jgi:hypothetical protein